MPLTPLEPWILARIGYEAGSGLSPRQAIDRYQLAKLRETLAYAKQASPFYRKYLEGFDAQGLKSLEQLAELPFTSPGDIRNDPFGFLCVPQRRIERIVTLATSGTTASPKRLFFTEEDLERTVDFFHHGMGTLVRPGERVLVLMPGDQPGSVGDLLTKGLARMGASALVHGLVRDPQEVLDLIVDQAVDCLVGLPVQVLALARHPLASKVKVGRLKSVLLSADYVPDAIVAELGACWQVPVFNHYGLTETGLGGGVECSFRCGYHLREADLYWEIIDPDTGHPQETGKGGEAVFTTLTRVGMPLIRYRTGDLARFLTEPCPCGTSLHRMERVQGRIASQVRLREGGILGIAALDEALFPLPFLLNFQATLSGDALAENLCLEIATLTPTDPGWQEASQRALLEIPAIAEAVACGRLTLSCTQECEIPPLSGSVKRTIVDKRERSAC